MHTIIVANDSGEPTEDDLRRVREYIEEHQVGMSEPHTFMVTESAVIELEDA